MAALDSSPTRSFVLAFSSAVAFASIISFAQAMNTKRISFSLPDWSRNIDYSKVYRTDMEMMELAIYCSRKNVESGTGGPFGKYPAFTSSAIFERFEDGSAKLVSIGCNRVVPENNSLLHGETVAIQCAQQKLKTFSLLQLGNFELFTSCEPCCMCLGATLWSGVSRIVCAASKNDASAIGFDEGPVYDSSYEHLEKAGIKVVRGVMGPEAAKVLKHYGEIGTIYNR